MVSLVASFYAVLFPLDVLDETWDLIEPVSEECLIYSLSLRKLFAPRGASFLLLELILIEMGGRNGNLELLP